MQSQEPVLESTARPQSFAAIDAAVGVARLAQSRWSQVKLSERLRIVGRLRGRIAEESRQLAECIEAGQRELADSLTAEVIPLADACRFLERNAGQILRPRHGGRWSRPLWLASVRLEIHREPVGLVLIIGPGNYPLFLPGVQVLQALVAGNAVLLKPAPGGAEPLVRLRRMLVDSGLDPDLLTLLDPDPMSAETTIDAGVDKVILTGSASTGRQVLRQLSPHLIPAVMELSGCDAVFVCADADLDLTARSLIFGLSLNGGRTCIAPRRVFVPSDLEVPLQQRLIALARDLPFVPVPLQTIRLLSDHLDEARREGARVLCGEVDRSRSCVRPLILGDAKPTMALLQADVFAPILSLVSVEDEEQALEWSAQCPYALGATVFGGSTARGMAQRVDAGVVVINDMIVPHADPRLPFAPRGQSGFGVTRGAEGLLEMTRIKAISRRAGRLRPHLEPRQSEDAQLFHAYLLATHARSWPRRMGALGQLARTLFRRSRSDGASS